VVWELHHGEPILDLRLFKNYNFAVANLMMFILGMILFSSLVMLPQFLQTLMGYTAESAGMVLSASGLVILMEMPIVGQLTTKIPAKYIIAFGWLSLACGLYYSVGRLDLLISFRSATWMRLTQAFGMGFLFVPITLVAYVGISPERSNNVAGLINFMRNIGSSVGTSMVTTLLARGAQVHQTALSFHTTASDQAFQNEVAGLSQQLIHSGASPADASGEAYARIYQGMQAQAATLAYMDTFLLLAAAAGVMFLLAFIVRRNNPGGGGDIAVG
jgi:DHA2 family multidrug resistance protein